MTVLLLAPASLEGQPELPISYQNGRILFQTNCGPCHSIHQELTGPMLASITKKKAERWLIDFIQNSQKVIISGDAYANFMFKQYDNQVMPAFQRLTDPEIRDILYYIEYDSRLPPDLHSTQFVRTGNKADPRALRGKVIFENQCLPCHFVDRESAGPALGSITRRHPREWLRSFIRNSQDVIRSGDPYANLLYENFGKQIMVKMPFLKDDEIDDVLHYIELSSRKQVKPVSRRSEHKGRIDHGVESPPSDQGAIDLSKLILAFILAAAACAFAYLLFRLDRLLQER